MKNHRQHENRVKQNAIMIFLLAVLLCGGLIHYVITTKNSISNQRDNIKKNEAILSLTNQLIEKINKAQSYANLYSLSGNENHLNNFRITISNIPQLNDSITRLCDEGFDTTTLNEATSLLQKKEKNIEAISKQLKSFNPYVEIYSIIDDYHPSPKN